MPAAMQQAALVAARWMPGSAGGVRRPHERQGVHTVGVLPAPSVSLRLALSSRHGVANACRQRRSPPRAATQGVDGALHDDEAGNMLPIDPDSEEGLGGTTAEQRFGPDALLLCGFLPSEGDAVRALLADLGADFIRVLQLEEGMQFLTLGQALVAEQPARPLRPALGVPRILFMSGMSSQEVSMFIDAFLECDLGPAPMFAAAVPRSVDKTLSQLFEEISGDHERLAQLKAERAASQ